jgi:hypothetical protein
MIPHLCFVEYNFVDAWLVQEVLTTVVGGSWVGR